MEQSPLIQKESVVRNEQFELLEQLDGFKKLSPKQQQMIRISLYVQQRAERGTDAGSKENLGISTETGDVFINYPREINDSNQLIKNPYRTSQRHIYDWYCHATVTGLERETVEKKVFYETDVSELLNKTGYEIKSKEDIADFVEIALNSLELPAVLHVLGGYDPVLHSAVILGRDTSGAFVLWEKKGVSIPYQLTTLEQIYNDYSSHQQEWLVRPFNSQPLEGEE